MTFVDLENPEYAHAFGFLQMNGHLATDVGKRGRSSPEIGDATAAAAVLGRTTASCGMRPWRLRTGQEVSPPPGIRLSP